MPCPAKFRAAAQTVRPASCAPLSISRSCSGENSRDVPGPSHLDRPSQIQSSQSGRLCTSFLRKRAGYNSSPKSEDTPGEPARKLKKKCSRPHLYHFNPSYSRARSHQLLASRRVSIKRQPEESMGKMEDQHDGTARASARGATERNPARSAGKATAQNAQAPEGRPSLPARKCENVRERAASLRPREKAGQKATVLSAAR